MGHGRHRHGPGLRHQPAGALGVTLAFAVGFGVFVVAMITLAVLAIRWGVRRDRLARALQVDASGPPHPQGGAPVAPGTTPNRGAS